MKNNFAIIVINFASSVLNILKVFLQTYLQAKHFEESTLTYMMSKMSSNCNWVPFIHKITQKGGYEKNINYSTLVVPFQFSDETLLKLLNELIMMRKSKHTEKANPDP